MPIYGTATFTDNSVNSGVVDAGVFQDTSINDGEVSAAVFEDSSVNTGHVTDYANFEGDSIDEGSIDPNAEYQQYGENAQGPSYQTIEEWLSENPVEGSYGNGSAQQEDNVAPARPVETDQNINVSELLPSLAGEDDDLYPETSDNWSVPGDDFTSWVDVDPFETIPNNSDGYEEKHQIAALIANTETYRLQLAPVCSDFLFSKHEGVNPSRSTSTYQMKWTEYDNAAGAIQYPGINIIGPTMVNGTYTYPNGAVEANIQNCVSINLNNGICEDLDKDRIAIYKTIWEAYTNEAPLTALDPSYENIYVRSCLNPESFIHEVSTGKYRFSQEWAYLPTYNDEYYSISVSDSTASYSHTVGNVTRLEYEVLSKFYTDQFAILFTLYSQEDADTIGCGSYVVPENLNKASLTGGMFLCKAKSKIIRLNSDEPDDVTDDVWIGMGCQGPEYDSFCWESNWAPIGGFMPGIDCCETPGLAYQPVSHYEVNSAEIYHTLNYPSGVVGKDYTYTWQRAIAEAKNRCMVHLWPKKCKNFNLLPVPSGDLNIPTRTFTGRATLFGLNGLGGADRKPSGKLADNGVGKWMIPGTSQNYVTKDPTQFGISLNIGAIEMLWGTTSVNLMKLIDPHVKIEANGKSIVVPLVDSGPGLSTKNGIDLTYATVNYLFGEAGKGRPWSKWWAAPSGAIKITPTQRGLDLTPENVLQYFGDKINNFVAPLIPKSKKKSRRSMAKLSSVVRAAAGQGSAEEVSKYDTIAKYVKRSGLDYHYKKTPVSLGQVVTMIGYIPTPVTRSVKVVQGVATIVREGYDIIVNRAKVPNSGLTDRSLKARTKRLWVGIVNKVINTVTNSDEVHIAEIVINGAIKLITRKKSKWGLYKSVNYLRRIGMLPSGIGEIGDPKELKVTGYIGSSY